jgi:hypothetical protein
MRIEIKFAVLIAFILSGCQPVPKFIPDEDLHPVSAEDCMKKNGLWLDIPFKYCRLPLAGDFGKSCSDKAECIYYCVAIPLEQTPGEGGFGQCSETNAVFGRVQFIVRGRVTQVLNIY